MGHLLPTRTPVAATPTSPPPLMACVGDCGLDGRVSVADVVLAVGVTLGQAPLAACTDLDADLDGIATINELLYAVNSALEGCR